MPPPLVYTATKAGIIALWRKFIKSRSNFNAIACVIHSGSRRDAVLYSVGEEADHKPALPRNREDKRRAVLTLLNDSEWGRWSNYKLLPLVELIRRLCGMSALVLTTVFRSEKSTRTYKTKHGTVALLPTLAKLGK